MKEEIFKIFVVSFTDKKVICWVSETNERRRFKRDSLFPDKLFKGKNLLLTISFKGNSMITRCEPTKASRLKQLYNYYIRKTF